MKSLATAISAVSLAALSGAVFAWGWGPWGSGGNPGWVVGDAVGEAGKPLRGAGYAPCDGYAPYGYGVPVAPVTELTDAQKQAIAEQQAKAAEYFKTLQKQVAEFYANNPNPAFEMQRAMFEERNARLREMDESMREMQDDMARDSQDFTPYRPHDEAQPVYQDREAWRQEMEARMAEFRKAAEERHKAAAARLEKLRKEHASRMDELNKHLPDV